MKEQHFWGCLLRCPYKMKNWQTIEGSAYPLGVTYIKEEDAFNFALYSKHATEVTLLVYNDDDFVNPLFIYQFTYLINKYYLIPMPGEFFFLHSLAGKPHVFPGQMMEELLWEFF